MQNVKSRILFSISMITLLVVFSVPFITVQAKAQVHNNIQGVGLGMAGMLLGCQQEHISGDLSYGGAWNGYMPCGTKDQIEASYQNSALGTVVLLTGELYESKPNSAMVWAQVEFNKLKGEDTNVYAQIANDPNDVSFYRPGLGIELLAPLLGLWTWARNVTYLLFIVLIIFIAALILLRRSFGGQTPITLFNSIPSILVSLVLITFSYPISAVFIDIITIGTNVSQDLLISGSYAPGYQDVWVNPSGNIRLNQEHLQPDDPQVGIWEIVGTSGVTPCGEGEDCDLGNLIPQNTFSAVGAFGSLLTATLELFQSTGAANFLIRLVLGFTAFMASFKLFMLMLNKYVVLTLGPVLAPFYFFLAAIPSKSESMITMFFKSHLSAALTFVSIYFMFLFVLVIGNVESIGELSWIPPLMGYTYDSVSGSTGLFRSLIVFSIYLATPTVPTFIDKILEVPETNEFAEGVKNRLAGGASTLGNAGRQAIGSTAWGQKIPFLGGGR